MELGHEPPAFDHVADPLRLPLDGPLAQHEGDLHAQQLVEDEPAAGGLGRLHRVRVVDGGEGGAAVDEVEAVEPVLGHGVGEGPGPGQGLLDETGQLPRVETALLRGLGVDGHDPTGAVTHQVDDRVGHLPPVAEPLQLPEERGLGARPQLLRPPPLVEEDHVEVAGAVEHVDLDDHLPLPGPARLDPLHHGQHGRLLPHLEVGDVGLPGAVDVAPGVVGEQVEHRLDAYGGHGVELLDADALELAHRDGGQLRQPPPGHPAGAAGSSGWRMAWTRRPSMPAKSRGLQV